MQSDTSDSRLHFLPVNINIDGKRILIIGGGRVGLHKATILSRFTDSATIISPTFREGFQSLPFRLLQKAYEPADLDGAFLVYICTENDELNRRIKQDAEQRHVLASVCDNPSLCDFTSPQLTSIYPDHVKEGELAAATLKTLLKKSDMRHARTFRSNAKSIVERESTRHISPATHLAEEAMSFIRHNALKGIRAADVAKHLRVSRRLCDLRFKECHDMTILETILKIRFSELKRRLTSSNTSIRKIVAACGFACESHAKRMFKKRFGMSMREWRAKGLQRISG